MSTYHFVSIFSTTFISDLEIENGTLNRFIIFLCAAYKLDVEVNKKKRIFFYIPIVSFNIPTYISPKAVSFIISYHVSS